MQTKSIFYYSLVVFTLSTHGIPLNHKEKSNNVKRSPAGLDEIASLLGGAGAAGGAAAEGGASANGSVAAGGSASTGGAADILSGITGGGDLLNSLPVKRDTYKRSPAGLDEITSLLGGAAGGAGAGGKAGVEGGAGAGGSAGILSGITGGGDLLNSLPVKRDTYK
ncbi:hypothetical protein GcM1_168005 [Golovinomyces cichoracearum]|uniref:Uncharacterized protein n=1 Tax=Golovinomyces cichoracearum TaxID=62708 RepID=A0A420J7D7_9PEZI|nr:hypothetical protein GcM1_168005 [Golovinomyces cichoracearum]